MFVLKGRVATIRLTSVSFSPDGTRLATCGERGELRVWEVASRKCIAAPPAHWDNLAAFFGADKSELFVLNRYTKALTSHALESRSSHFVGHMDLVAPSLNGRQAFGCTDASEPAVTCYSLMPLTTLWSVLCSGVAGEHIAPVACLSCSPDGRRVACGHVNGRVRLLDADTGTCLLHTGNAGSPGGARAIAVSPGGEALAWCGASNLHFERRAESLTVHHCLGKTHFLSIAWHPSGAFFDTGNGDGKVDTWDALTGQHRTSLDWGAGKLTGIAFDPSGSLGAACSHTGQVVVWDVDL